MNDARYEPSDVADKRRISDLMTSMGVMGDFIEWLFDHSEHCDHITYNEAWEEFKQWEEKQTN